MGFESEIEFRNLYFSAVEHIFISAANSDSNGIYMFVSQNIASKTWIQSETTTGNAVGNLVFASTFDGAVFTVIYRDSKTFLLRTHTNLLISVTETVPTLALTDIRLSLDFVEKALLDLNNLCTK